MAESFDALTLAEQAMEHDPRQAPFGLFYGGSAAHDRVRVFVWFESLEGVGHFIQNILPLLYECQGEDLTNFKRAAQPVLEKLKASGLGSDFRLFANQMFKEMVAIDWCGSFSDLLTGNGEFAENLRNDFHAGPKLENAAPVAAEKIDDFIEFLKNYGV